jgi:glycosyltransferase involved in cell wall biosynthesis
MRILRNPTGLQPCVLVLGMFDGVHRGHQALLMAGVELAEAAGLPVIASRIGGIPDIFEANGCLIDVNDENALVDAMLLLAKEEPLRQEMGEKSQAIAKKYAADVIASQYVALYRKYGRKDG